MPATHEIDSANRLIITTWSGKATESEFIDTLISYQLKVKGNREYQTYNELLDFSQIDNINLSKKSMTTLSKIAQQTDRQDVQTRLAIIVSSPLAFGLARMYVAYRNLLQYTNKELKVFKNRSDAFAWVINQ